MMMMMVRMVTCVACPDNQFRCTNGQCISACKRCDENSDCDDNSDETNCCKYYIHTYIHTEGSKRKNVVVILNGLPLFLLHNLFTFWSYSMLGNDIHVRVPKNLL